MSSILSTSEATSGPGSADARVVDQHGDAGIGPQDVLDALQVRRRREVGFDRLDLPAGFVGEPARQRCEPLPVARDQNEIVAALGQTIGVDRTDAGGCAGDEGSAFGSAVMSVSIWLVEFVASQPMDRPFRN